MNGPNATHCCRLGGRHINDSETVITGLNAFFDYEIVGRRKNSSQSTGIGAELLTSMLEFRTNKYTRASSTLTVDGINETALDGYDEHHSLKQLDHQTEFLFVGRLFHTD